MRDKPRTTGTPVTTTTGPSATGPLPPRRPAGPVLVVVAAVCWGTGGLAGSLLGSATGLSPVAVGAYRLLVAAVLLLAAQLLLRGGAVRLAGSVRTLLDRRADAARVVGAGLGLALFQTCYFVAVGALGVSVATLLTLGLAPVLVTLAAAVLLRERVGGRLRAALPVALLGLVLLVGVAGGAPGGTPGVSDGAGGAGGVGGAPGGSAYLLGVLAACTSAAGYAAVTLLGRSLAARVEPAHVTTLGFVVAATAALPAGLLTGMALAPDPGSLALVLYLGAVPTALAYGLFFAGLRGTASGTASVLTLVEPLTATVLAVLVLGERLGPVQVGGAVLLVVAVLVLSVPGRRGAPTLGR